MFKIMCCLFALAAVASATAKADPKPGVIAYSAPAAVLAAAPAYVAPAAATVYETSFHGNLAPAAALAAAYSTPYLTAPLAYSTFYDPLVASTVLLRK